MRILSEIVGIILMNLAGFMFGYALSAAFTIGLVYGVVNCLF